MDQIELMRKVGQLIMVEIPGKQLTEETAAFIRECHPAGVVLFGTNWRGPWAMTKLIADLQAVAAEAGDDPLIIGMDQEGGQVSHLRYPCVEMPSAMARAAAGIDTVRESAEILGREMVRLGINMAFAPVADVNNNHDNPVIGARAFSDDPAVVCACTTATVEGLRKSGVLSMAKHFPGHGDTSVDSHVGLPSVSHGWDRMREVELAPFRAAIEAGVDSIITAHVVYPCIDDSGLPATLSPTLMTGLLRDELGFKGALISDALVMDAIARRDSANIPPAAIAAIQAGNDCAMLLGSLGTQRNTYDALVDAVQNNAITEARLTQSVERMRALRLRVASPDSHAAWPDMEHLRAARRIALAGITLVRDNDGLLPLQGDGDGLGVIEFPSGRIAAVEGARNEPLNGSLLALLLGRRLPEARFLALPSLAPFAADILAEFASGCDRIIVATRNAQLDHEQAGLLSQLVDLAGGRPIVQVAMRGPYDAELEPRIGTVLLTYGDQPDSVAALVDVLLGDAQATGKAPVSLDTPGRVEVQL
ncbi:MAG: glycoside hydrolase family 3 protein [Chloroflexota bacterium]